MKEKELHNPEQLIKYIDKGKYSTSETDNAYRDHIYLNKQLNKPIKVKRLEKCYFSFLLMNEAKFPRLEQIERNKKLKDEEMIR